ncbi:MULTISPECIES: DUF3429 domain-containing protein [Marinobacter]|uniref:DUF3429 domain-containing protein n=1 Tax=Marinobacter suaedae TaxID=3057675 RepID=A0ABT8VZX2_9GAMM|nr:MULTISPECIES: DUF3429 domain-containing protein [unclassified Marinobacter]MBZ2169677.1 DUF3429 domain-containing protein [Marinobacter sp. F4216]MDO3721510.1 DUF3429 domain-containing protein [Marinobacter sp. chi1]
MISVSRIAVLVGLAGLVPFLAGVLSLYLLPQYHGSILYWFYLYSAGILAFMAGVYWPIAMQLGDRTYPQSPVVTIVLSQVFFLTAGLGLIPPVGAQVFIYTAAFVGLCLVDVKWMKSFWPSWYLRLRLLLTSVVVVCQILVAAWYFAVTSGA